MLNDQVRPFRDFKKAAAGDRDDDFDLTPTKREIETTALKNISPLEKRPLIVRVLRPAQITARAERKIPKLTPSNKDWISTIKRIFAGTV